MARSCHTHIPRQNKTKKKKLIISQNLGSGPKLSVNPYLRIWNWKHKDRQQLGFSCAKKTIFNHSRWQWYRRKETHERGCIWGCEWVGRYSSATMTQTQSLMHTSIIPGLSFLKEKLSLEHPSMSKRHPARHIMTPLEISNKIFFFFFFFVLKKFRLSF